MQALPIRIFTEVDLNSGAPSTEFNRVIRAIEPGDLMQALAL